MKREILDKIIKIFEQSGVMIYEDKLEEPLDYDSLQFISIIADLEEAFSIQISDEVFISEEINTIKDFYYIVIKQLEG